MKKSMLFNFVSVLYFSLLLVGCGKESIVKESIIIDDIEINYKVDAPYYGDITIGASTIKMFSTDDMLKAAGMERNMTSAFNYEDKNTDDEFRYNMSHYDDYYSVEFSTHNNIYNENGCDNCDDVLSNFVRLPKNITYNSTIEDVLSNYGTPVIKEDYEDYNYHLVLQESSIDAVRVVYVYEQDNVYLNLELLFNKEDSKLYHIGYVMKLYQN